MSTDGPLQTRPYEQASALQLRAHHPPPRVRALWGRGRAWQGPVVTASRRARVAPPCASSGWAPPPAPSPAALATAVASPCADPGDPAAHHHPPSQQLKGETHCMYLDTRHVSCSSFFPRDPSFPPPPGEVPPAEGAGVKFSQFPFFWHCISPSLLGHICGTRRIPGWRAVPLLPPSSGQMSHCLPAAVAAGERSSPAQSPLLVTCCFHRLLL